jgi:hypothetical protein
MSSRFSFPAVVASSLIFALAIACGGSAQKGADSPGGSDTSAASAASDHSVDGKSFDVTLEISGESAEKDTLKFATGKFESTACTGVGFAQWTEYSSKAENGATSFHVVTKHPDGTTIDWNGSVHGDAIEGTATRTVKGKAGTGKFSGTARK